MAEGPKLVKVAQRAEREATEMADISIEAAGLAKEAARDARRDALGVRDLMPDVNRDMIRELASLEGGAMLAIGPRRHPWRDLQALDERIADTARRQDEISREIGKLRAEAHVEPERHARALADWFTAGNEGDRPESRAATFDEKIGDLQAEYAALGVHHQRLLDERVGHVQKHRERFVADVRKRKQEKADEMLALIDQLEGARQDLLDLRQNEVWAGLFPNAALTGEPNTASLVGAKRRIQEPLLPGVKANLVASAVFELLRADVGFCRSVATAEQAALEQGVTVAELTGRDARWEEGSGKPDFVGPDFGAAWGGSSEEKAIGEQIAAYTEATRRRLRGD